jgi:hypothetical protein
MWGKVDTLHSTRARRKNSTKCEVNWTHYTLRELEALVYLFSTEIACLKIAKFYNHRAPNKNSWPLLFISNDIPPSRFHEMNPLLLRSRDFPCFGAELCESEVKPREMTVGDQEECLGGGGLFELKFATFLGRLLSLMRGSWAEQKTVETRRAPWSFAGSESLWSLVLFLE